MGPKRFVNQEKVEHHNSYKQFQRWRQERLRKMKLKDYSYTVPNVQPDIAYLHNNRQHPSVTWVGHSTFLIQLGGLNIVTDPVWAGKMAFQKRLAPPGIPIEEMPPIDVVLVSHSHYDHLSISSLRKLAGPMQLLVPAGLSAKLRLKGFERIAELHWWEEIAVGGVTFTFVPSQHWTRRNPWDTNSSHWGGWIMEPNRPETTDAQLPLAKPPGADLAAAILDSYISDEDGQDAAEDSAGHDGPPGGRPVVAEAPTVYFAGDSGYFRGFKEIGERKRIDVALMPIGAYEPEWFMGPQHVTPEESLQAFADTKAGWFVPMHYGSFKLADDTPREALDRLEACRRKRGLAEERMVVLPHGETWRLAGK